MKRNVDCRLNVDKTGFVFEFDPYWWNIDLYVKSRIFYPFNLMNYTFKYPDPEEISNDQLDYFVNLTESLEKAVVDGKYENTSIRNHSHRGCLLRTSSAIGTEEDRIIILLNTTIQKSQK